MIIYDALTEFYDRIKKKNNILVLSSSDVDALCSTKILIDLLKIEHIPHVLICISSIKQFISNLDQNKTINDVIVCINCGGGIDIKEAVPNLDTDIYILDCSAIHSVANTNNIDHIYVMKCQDAESEVDITRSVQVDSDASNHTYQRGMNMYPTSRLVFELCVKLRKENINILWACMCGITSNYLCEKMNRENYVSHVTFLQQHLLRITMNSGIDRQEVDSYKMTISYSNEFNLYLYRHWSLMNSMTNSRCTSCHFRIWTLKGKKRLLEYLAHAGIPLKQSQEKFSLMALEYKNNLKDLLDKHMKKFKIKDFTVPSFVANYGYQLEVSALDLSLCLMILLDYGEENENDLIKHFMQALRILDRSYIDDVEKVINKSICCIRSLCELIQTFIELHYIVSAGPYHLAVIPEGFITSFNRSNGPLLLFLAKFLLSAHASTIRNKNVNRLPLVLCLPSDIPEISLVIGIPSLIDDDMNFNQIGQYFDVALEQTGIEISKPFFDNNIIHIPTAKRGIFLDALIEIID